MIVSRPAVHYQKLNCVASYRTSNNRDLKLFMEVQFWCWFTGVGPLHCVVRCRCSAVMYCCCESLVFCVQGLGDGKASQRRTQVEIPQKRASSDCEELSELTSDNISPDPGSVLMSFRSSEWGVTSTSELQRSSELFLNLHSCVFCKKSNTERCMCVW